MKNLIKNKTIWNSKEMRFGGYSVIATSLLFCFLLILNLIFSSLNIKIDLTEEKFFSLSDKTLSIVQGIEDPINIYVLEETGAENKDFQDILNKYEKESDKISVIYKDPVLYPQFAQKYMDLTTDGMEQSIPTGSIIIENTVTGQFRTILYQELYNIGFDQSYGPYIQSVAIEERVTGGIDYVTNGIERRVLVTEGHGEYTIPFTIFDQLEKENFIVENINLLTDELEPNPNDTLLIYSPHIDFQESERDKVLAFLEQGGKAVIFTDFNTPDMPNFDQILSTYGLQVEEGVVVEGSSDHMLSSSPNFILPEIADHDITSILLENKLPIVMPLAGGLSEMENKRNSVTLTPLLTSSNNSWLKADLDATTIEKEDGDQDGPIHLAYAIEDTNTNTTEPITTKLMVISNTLFLDNSQFNVDSSGNIDFIMNGFLWLQGKDNSLQIGPKASASYFLPPLSGTTFLILAGVSLILIPLTIITWGIITWLKRRHL